MAASSRDSRWLSDSLSEQQHRVCGLVVAEAERFGEFFALLLRELLVHRVHDVLQPPDRFVEGMYGDAEPLRELLAAVGAAGQHQHAQKLDFFIEAFSGHGQPPLS